MPLLQDEKDGSAKEDQYEFDEGQNAVSQMLQLIYNQNNDMWYALLLKFKKIFMKGGADRMKFTLPALVFSLFKLSSQVESVGPSQEATVDEDGMQLLRVDQGKIFKITHELIGAI